LNRFLGVSPRLTVANLERTVTFYRDVLGFTAGDPWPAEAPAFIVMARDDVTLQFRLAEAGEAIGAASISIDVGDAIAILAAVRERVIIEWGPEVYWYGRREFSFRDPDGYPIIISEVTDDPPTCHG
jgi:catechol 2,3-dioxygenase-like lactoylglutathione lyase family enzyme